MLLESITKAELFILNASADIEKDITNPQSWLKYDELKYVEQMNGLF